MVIGCASCSSTRRLPKLVKRYDSSRRKHPLNAEAEGLVEAIELERSLLDPVRSAADLVIDTTDLNIHQLKAKLIAAFDQTGDGQRLQVAIESFGYKYGLPLDADIVMDVRFLPNPHWEELLRPLTGHDPAVRDYRVGAFPRLAVPRRVRSDDGQPRAGVRGRGQDVPDHRDGLHRRSSSQRRSRRRSGGPAARPRDRRHHRVIATSPADEIGVVAGRDYPQSFVVPERNHRA